MGGYFLRRIVTVEPINTIKTRPDSSQKGPLKAEAWQTFRLAISTTSNPATAKVTFSKIILADGTTVNPHKSLVTKSKSPFADFNTKYHCHTSV
jgi:hypothetical protein